MKSRTGRPIKLEKETNVTTEAGGKANIQAKAVAVDASKGYSNKAIF